MYFLNRKQVQEILKKSNNAPVIDVLSPESYKHVHIPGTYNVYYTGSDVISQRDFANKVCRLTNNRSKPVVLYCAGPACEMSVKASKALENEGFTHVFQYRGGLQDWRDAGLYVVTDLRSHNFNNERSVLNKNLQEHNF